MQLECSGLWRLWPSVLQACNITISLTISALVLSCRTLKTFYVLWMTTLWTSISYFMCLIWITFFLVRWPLILVLTWVPLLTLWSRPVGMLFPLVPAWLEVCSLVLHKISLSHLVVTCNLFYMPSNRLWGFHFLGKLPHLTCWKLL